MKISIIGLGWFGLALAQELQKKHSVFGTTRTLEKFKKIQVFVPNIFLLNHKEVPAPSLFQADSIVINIPPSKDQLQWLKEWNIPLEKHIIFISSTSVYGQSQTDVSEETLPLPDSENGMILVEQEDWIKTFPSFTIIRFGGLIGPDRHPGRHLSGKHNLVGGNWPVNLIHQKDAVFFTQHVIENKIVGEIFNLVHPNHPTRKDYYQHYCELNNLIRPHFVEDIEPGKKVSSLKVEKIYQFKESI